MVDLCDLRLTSRRGTWVVHTLAANYPDYYHLVSFDNLEYGASSNNIRTLNPRLNFTFVKGDILNPHDVKSCLEEYQIDAIIHLAAQTNVDASLKNPFAFASTNIEGTQVILECAKQCGVKKFIQMSSFEAYGATKPGVNGHREDESLAPMNPYGAGKAAAEMLVIAAGHSCPLEVMVVRANNIYGPKQFPDSEATPCPSIKGSAHYDGQRSSQSSSCYSVEASS